MSDIKAPEYPAIAATFGNFPLESLISQLRLDLNWKAPSKITSRGPHLRSEIKGNEKRAQFQLPCKDGKQQRRQRQEQEKLVRQQHEQRYP